MQQAVASDRELDKPVAIDANEYARMRCRDHLRSRSRRDDTVRVAALDESSSVAADELDQRRDA